MNYCIYLRKSRADADDERNGIDTLNRHQNILMDTAKRLDLEIKNIYKEVVSGDSIKARPVMLNLLSEITRGMWDGVLVVEIERLARGDTIDQGEVARAFKFNNTKIITPIKTYDPQSEMDEEFFEFALFMSRREYKTIKRRLVAGMNQASVEGKFTKATPAYGYDKIKLSQYVLIEKPSNSNPTLCIEHTQDTPLLTLPQHPTHLKSATYQKGYTLIQNCDSPAVLMIYTMFLEGSTYKTIAKTLEYMGYLPKKSEHWSPSSIKAILTNPVYAGYIRNGYRASKSTLIDGEIKKTRPRNDNAPLYDGLHIPIIDLDTWHTVQSIINVRKSPPVKDNSTLQNPLAQLVYCGNCGILMGRKSDKNGSSYIYCKGCSITTSCSTDIVEQRVLLSLLEHLKDTPLHLYKNKPILYNKINKKSTDKLASNITKITIQISKLHDLLEQGIYDADTFKKRYNALSQKLLEYNNNLYTMQSTEKNILMPTLINTENIINSLENIVELYYLCENASEKNTLLKTLIKSITYYKTKRGTKKNPATDLTIVVDIIK